MVNKRKSKSVIDQELSHTERIRILFSLTSQDKWTEENFSQATNYLSALKNINESEKYEVVKSLYQVPHTHLPRLLFRLVNDNYIDFISNRSKPRFPFIRSYRQELSEFIIQWIDLDKSLADSIQNNRNINEYAQELSQKINYQYSKKKDYNKRLKWEEVEAIDRIRLIYSLKVLSVSLTTSQISNVCDLLSCIVHLFARVLPNSDDAESISKASEIKKLKIYSKVLRGNKTTDQLESLSQLENVVKSEKDKLINENRSLTRSRRALSKRIDALDKDINDCEVRHQSLLLNHKSNLEELENLKTEYQELEEAYRRFKEASKVDTQKVIDSQLSQASQEAAHQFSKLKRGIDKYILDEEVKKRFGQIISKIEKAIQIEGESK